MPTLDFLNLKSVEFEEILDIDEMRVVYFTNLFSKGD